MPWFAGSPETFVVEEIAAYLPAGEGEHTFVWIEKRGLTTLDAVGELGRRLRIAPRDIGYAGMKDRHATTRQWLSLPRVPPEAVLEAAGAAPAGDGPSLRVLRALRHGNKLRVGHLVGNRFETVIGGVGGAAGAAKLAAELARVVDGGLPNRYGDQRFGAGGDNATRGLALLRGGRDGRGGRDRRLRRLMLSAAQAAVFNNVLALRAAEGLLRTVLAGDVLQRRETGGVFVSDDAAADQQRLDAGELVITGPMPGGWAREPPPGTPARAIEDRALAALEATREAFASVGRELPGTRRPLLAVVTPGAPPLVAEDGAAGADGAAAGADTGTGEGTGADADAAAGPRTVRLAFALPSGSYATVLLEELGVELARGPRTAVESPPADAPDAPEAPDEP